MSASPKVKVSLTLSSDLIALVDRDAEKLGSTRSGVIDAWLRRAAKASAADAIHDATVKYYKSLSPEDVADNEAWALASSNAAKHIRYDANTSTPNAAKPTTRGKRR